MCVKKCFLISFFTRLNITTLSASTFVLDRWDSVIILQVGPAYLASWAQACLCLFIVIPLKVSSSPFLSVDLPAFPPSSRFYHLSSPPLPPNPQTHTLTNTASHFTPPPPTSPTSWTRKEESDRMVVTWNLGRSCRALRRRWKTPWGVKAVQSHKEKSSPRETLPAD